MAAEILEEHALALPGGVTIEPSSGGVFEIYLNDELIYSKKQLGRFPEPGDVVQRIRAKLE